MVSVVTDLQLRTPDPTTRAPSPAARRRVRQGFVAIAELVGDWWYVEVPQLPGVTGHCSRIGQVEDIARDSIALALGQDPGEFDVRVIVVEPGASSSPRTTR